MMKKNKVSRIGEKEVEEEGWGEGRKGPSSRRKKKRGNKSSGVTV